MIGFPPLLTAVLSLLGPLAYWALLEIVILVGVAFAAAGTRRPTTAIVVATSGCLVVALALVSVPAPETRFGLALPLILVGAGALALSVLGGSAASQWVLLHSSGGAQRGANGGIVVEARQADGVERSQEVLRGGMVIGFFERLATTAAIIAGFPDAIAVVVAVKGVGRFTELSESETRERFIIGTLVSLVWASACGAVFHFATR